MKRCSLVLVCAQVLGACGGVSPHVCTAYDAAREAACDACARMPAVCPFPHDAEAR